MTGATGPDGNGERGGMLGRALRGGALLAVGHAIGQGFGWIRTLVLARLLIPEDFGLVGMATVLLGWLNVVANLGLSEALIQRKQLETAHKDAAFWSSFGIGALLFGGTCAGAPVLASFYKEPRVSWILIAAALSLVISPFATTHAALLRRDLRFGLVARVELVRTVVSGVTSIAAAAAGLEHWSLVVGLLAMHLTGAVAYRLADTSWRPGLRATRRHARELFAFSMYVAGGSAVNYMGANVDYLMVGRVLGALPLGIYTLAYETMTFPLTRISSVVGQVMFPAFSRLQDDAEEMRWTYVTISRSLALVCLPVLAWIAVAAPELVVLVYGEKWLPVVPVLRVLAIAGGLKSVGTVVGLAYRAKGKSHVELWWNIVWLAAISATILGSIRWGIVGVAAGISALCVPGVLFTEWLACKYMDMPLRRLLRALVLPAAATGCMAAAGFGLRSALLADLPAGRLWDGARLAALTVTMLVVYAGVLRIFHPGIVSESRSLLSHFRAKKSGRPADRPPKDGD